VTKLFIPVVSDLLPPTSINSVISSEKYKKIITLNGTNAIRIWDHRMNVIALLDTTKYMKQDLRNSYAAITSIALSSDEKYLFCTAGYQDIQIWELGSLRYLKTVSFAEDVRVRSLFQITTKPASVGVITLTNRIVIVNNNGDITDTEFDSPFGPGYIQSSTKYGKYIFISGGKENSLLIIDLDNPDDYEYYQAPTGSIIISAFLQNERVLAIWEQYDDHNGLQPHNRMKTITLGQLDNHSTIMQFGVKGYHGAMHSVFIDDNIVVMGHGPNCIYPVSEFKY